MSYLGTLTNKTVEFHQGVSLDNKIQSVASSNVFISGSAGPVDLNIGNAFYITKTGNTNIEGRLISFGNAASISTAADVVYTFKQTLDGYIIRDPGSSARTDTFQRADAIVAAVASKFNDVSVGNSWKTIIKNTGNKKITLSGNTGTTLLGGTQIPSDHAGSLLTVITNSTPLAEAVTVYFTGLTQNAKGGASNVFITPLAAATYTVLPTDQFISVTYTATAPVTITMPLANAVVSGMVVTIADMGLNSQNNNITINRSGTNLIEGNTSVLLNTNGQTVSLIADGTSAWFIY